MAYFGPGPQFLAEYTARNAEIEQKLTNEQLQYVRQRYRMNKYASPMEIRQIVTQLDIDDSEFYIDLTEWFFYRRSMEYENEQYRYQLARIAA